MFTIEELLVLTKVLRLHLDNENLHSYSNEKETTLNLYRTLQSQVEEKFNVPEHLRIPKQVSNKP